MTYYHLSQPPNPVKLNLASPCKPVEKYSHPQTGFPGQAVHADIRG